MAVVTPASRTGRGETDGEVDRLAGERMRRAAGGSGGGGGGDDGRGDGEDGREGGAEIGTEQAAAWFRQP
uniref:Uncharacterized protein n=1 Tax=Oryza glumipatula TaxID=40148 RepID=A0A0E0AHQ4_9ORYZ